MATHSNILAWRISWTGVWQAKVHGIAKGSDKTERLTLSFFRGRVRGFLRQHLHPRTPTHTHVRARTHTHTHTHTHHHRGTNRSRKSVTVMAVHSDCLRSNLGSTSCQLWLWTSYLTCLGLSSCIYKMGIIIIINNIMAEGGIKRVNTGKV